MTDKEGDTTPLDLFGTQQVDSGGDSLAKQMGRDAQRVASGELSQATFYERYHDEVVERFGFDRRPGGDDG